MRFKKMSELGGELLFNLTNQGVMAARVRPSSSTLHKVTKTLRSAGLFAKRHFSTEKKPSFGPYVVREGDITESTIRNGKLVSLAEGEAVVAKEIDLEGLELMRLTDGLSETDASIFYTFEEPDIKDGIFDGLMDYVGWEKSQNAEVVFDVLDNRLDPKNLSLLEKDAPDLVEKIKSTMSFT